MHRARQALGDAASQAVAAAGRALTLEQALAEAEAVLELSRAKGTVPSHEPPDARVPTASSPILNEGDARAHDVQRQNYPRNWTVPTPSPGPRSSIRWLGSSGHAALICPTRRHR